MEPTFTSLLKGASIGVRFVTCYMNSSKWFNAYVFFVQYAAQTNVQIYGFVHFFPVLLSVQRVYMRFAFKLLLKFQSLVYTLFTEMSCSIQRNKDHSQNYIVHNSSAKTKSDKPRLTQKYQLDLTEIKPKSNKQNKKKHFKKLKHTHAYKKANKTYLVLFGYCHQPKSRYLPRVWLVKISCVLEV